VSTGAGADRPTRSVTAETAGTAAAVARQRLAQPNGWWGMVLFLCAEATLFGTLIGTYFYLDFDAHRWPPAGIKAPSVVAPAVITAVLLTSSVPMLLAVRASRAGARRPVAWLIVLALVIQTVFLGVQIYLFRHDFLQFSPQATAYGSIYFTLLAAHDAHVLFGLLLDFGVLWHVGARKLNSYWLIGVRSLALYWHVVNVLAVIVVLTQLSPSL